MKQDPSTTEESGYLSAGVQITKTIMGAGILGMPIILKSMGLIPGILFLVLNAIVTIYSIYFLLELKDIVKQTGYAPFAKVALGSVGPNLVDYSLIICNFGICCAYFKIAGEVMSIVLKTIFSIKEGTPFFASPEFIIILLFLLMLPLMFKDDISALKKASFLGVTAITVFLTAVIGIFFYKMYNGKLAPITTSMLWPSGTLTDILNSAPTVFFAYIFQVNAFDIYLTLKPKEKSNDLMKKATIFGVGYSSVLFILVGCLGYFMYGNALTGTLLASFKEDISMSSDNFALQAVLITVLISFFLSSSTSLPLFFFGCRKTALNLCEEYANKAKDSKEKTDKDTDKDTTTTTTTSTAMGQTVKTTRTLSYLDKCMITFALYLSIMVVTISVSSIMTLFNYIGSVACNAFNFLFPSLFLIIITKTPIFSFERLWPKIVFIMGILAMVVFFANEAMKMEIF